MKCMNFVSNVLQYTRNFFLCDLLECRPNLCMVVSHWNQSCIIHSSPTFHWNSYQYTNASCFPLGKARHCLVLSLLVTMTEQDTISYQAHRQTDWLMYTTYIYILLLNTSIPCCHVVLWDCHPCSVFHSKPRHVPIHHLATHLCMWFTPINFFLIPITIMRSMRNCCWSTAPINAFINHVQQQQMLFFPAEYCSINTWFTILATVCLTVIITDQIYQYFVMLHTVNAVNKNTMVSYDLYLWAAAAAGRRWNTVGWLNVCVSPWLRATHIFFETHMFCHVEWYIFGWSPRQHSS